MPFRNINTFNVSPFDFLLLSAVIKSFTIYIVIILFSREFFFSGYQMPSEKKSRASKWKNFCVLALYISHNKRFGHMLGKYSQAHWWNAKAFKIYIFIKYSLAFWPLCVRDESAKREQVIKMELKYKIDRHRPSHIMPIMQFTLSSFIRLSICMVSIYSISLSIAMNSFFHSPLHESMCVCVCVLFLLSHWVDCFLPLVQRDLWRICWLYRS